MLTYKTISYWDTTCLELEGRRVRCWLRTLSSCADSNCVRIAVHPRFLPPAVHDSHPPWSKQCIIRTGHERRRMPSVAATIERVNVPVLLPTTGVVLASAQPVDLFPNRPRHSLARFSQMRRRHVLRSCSVNEHSSKQSSAFVSSNTRATKLKQSRPAPTHPGKCPATWTGNRLHPEIELSAARPRNACTAIPLGLANIVPNKIIRIALSECNYDTNIAEDALHRRTLSFHNGFLPTLRVGLDIFRRRFEEFQLLSDQDLVFAQMFQIALQREWYTPGSRVCHHHGEHWTPDTTAATTIHRTKGHGGYHHHAHGGSNSTSSVGGGWIKHGIRWRTERWRSGHHGWVWKHGVTPWSHAVGWWCMATITRRWRGLPVTGGLAFFTLFFGACIGKRCTIIGRRPAAVRIIPSSSRRRTCWLRQHLRLIWLVILLLLLMLLLLLLLQLLVLWIHGMVRVGTTPLGVGGHAAVWIRTWRWWWEVAGKHMRARWEVVEGRHAHGSGRCATVRRRSERWIHHHASRMLWPVWVVSKVLRGSSRGSVRHLGLAAAGRRRSRDGRLHRVVFCTWQFDRVLWPFVSVLDFDVAIVLSRYSWCYFFLRYW